MSTAIEVDANLLQGNRRRGIVRHNERNVSGGRNHWVSSVEHALARASGVRMHIRYNLHGVSLAEFPKVAVVAAVEVHVALRQAIWIEVVIEDDATHRPHGPGQLPQ